MIHTIAIDDEPKALEIIQRHAERIPSLNLKAVFTDPFEALAYLNEQPIDLVFLDINMPDLSGLEFSKAIRKKEVLVVFTTAYSEYALESYEVEALDYLLKPFDFSRFLAAVSKAEERLKKPVNIARDFFFVNSGNQHHKICFEDLNYIEGSGNYITYFTQTEKVMVR